MKKRQDHPALQRGRTTEGRRTVKTRTNNIVSYPGNRAVGQKRKYSRPTVSSRSERLAVKKRVSKGSTVNKHTLGNKVPPLYIWGDFDVPFLLLTLALLGFGLVMMFSASYARAYYDFDNSFYFIGRQIVWSMIGITGMIAASFVNYHWLRRFVWPLYFVSIVLCMACYLFDAYNGARRSIYIGPLSFQPSEIGKLALIFLFAHLMTKDQDKMGRLWEGTLRYLVLFGGLAVVVVMQPHLSATLLMAGITVAMLFVGGAKIQHLIGVGVTGLAGIAALVVTMWGFFSDRFAHVLVRLSYWLDPFSSMDWGSYQTRQSLLAIGSGGLLGVGLGESRQKQLYLPEVQNDFVFAVVCEELGVFGAGLVILMFIYLLYQLYSVAQQAEDLFGRLLAIGVFSHVALQVILNLMVVTSIIPTTGVTLPFFSSGGTATVFLLIEIGMVLNVEKVSRFQRERELREARAV